MAPPFSFYTGKHVKIWKRIVALIGIAIGVGILFLDLTTCLFLLRGPFPSGVIDTGEVSIPFVWDNEIGWQGWVAMVLAATFAIALIVVSYRFGVRRRAQPGAAPSGAPAASLGKPVLPPGQ